MFSTSLLLLLAAASCVHCEELTQPGSMVVRPDQSLTIDCVHSQVVLTQSEGSVTVAPGGSYKLTCACSGFNPSGKWMAWVRQAPGKGLDWIINYFIERIKHTTQSVQGRFTASKDRSNFYLHMSQLKPEDTAVYYCVTHSGGTHTDSCTRTRVEDKQREGDSLLHKIVSW
ncbi:hypothetical protein NFI96_030280 [Prochilodus magdalenae]|nr:hypothetical protein NFI96_030280 [Prochilodus magdalenae]